MNRSKSLIGCFALLAASSLLFLGCDVSKAPLTPEEYLAQKLSLVNKPQLEHDLAIIDDSLDQWDITPLVEPKGVRYTIEVIGPGEKPNLSSTLVIKYRAKFLKTGLTAYQDNLVVKLYDLVIGLQTTLPFIKAGSKCTLYVPSQYAYGSDDINDAGTIIPKNSNLIYEVELLEVIN